MSNNSNCNELFEWLRKQTPVRISGEKITVEQVHKLQPEFIISYNYRYIISREVIDFMKGRIFNLHISYLPWNRGSDPNIWSFIDDTPKGVTIHQIDSGLDTGMILCQKACCFNIEKETFQSSYNKLNKAMIELFKENWNDIVEGKYELRQQEGEGTYHRRKDLELVREKIPFEWTDNIADFMRRYKDIQGICTAVPD